MVTTRNVLANLLVLYVKPMRIFCIVPSAGNSDVLKSLPRNFISIAQ
jgi:type III secretory pathway component EscT